MKNKEARHRIFGSPWTMYNQCNGHSRSKKGLVLYLELKTITPDEQMKTS